MKSRIIPIILFTTSLPALLRAEPVPAGPEFRVNTYTTTSQRAPAIAAGSAGGLVVVWETYLEGGAPNLSEIRGQRFTSAGGPVGEEIIVPRPVEGRNSDPAVARAPNGRFVVAWEAGVDLGTRGGVEADIWAQRYRADGLPTGGAFRVNSYTTSFQVSASVGTDDEGNFVIVWESSDQTGIGQSAIFGQRFQSNGARTGGEFQVSPFFYSYYGQDPDLTVAANGDFLVVWREEPGLSSRRGLPERLALARFNSKGTRTGGLDFPRGSSGTLQSPRLDRHPHGHFVVVWGEYGGIYGRRFDRDLGPVGATFPVSDSNTSQSDPEIRMDQNGGFVVAWRSYAQILAQRFTSDGLELGDLAVVNEPVGGTEFRPDLVVAPDSRFVVVWESYGRSDDDILGIRGRRFTNQIAYIHTLGGKPFPIPDNSFSGITDQIIISDPGLISDLDVELFITHTRVGDLAVRLENDPISRGARANTVLLERPGVIQNPPFGCTGDDIDVLLDDAASAPVQQECAAQPPAIGGAVSPRSPLSVFNDQEAAGAWTLSVRDELPNQTGALEEWALLLTYATPVPTQTPTPTAPPPPTPTPTIPPELNSLVSADSSQALNVRNMLPETDDLWVATPSGVACFNFDGETRLTTFDPLNSGLPSWDIRDVERTGDGLLWFATGDKGLAQLDQSFDEDNEPIRTWNVFNAGNTKDKQGTGGLTSDEVTAIAISPSALREGSNFLAVELHQVDSTSSDLIFNLELVGTLASAPGEEVTLVSASSRWQYLDDGSDQGAGWRVPGFVAPWPSGPAPLGYDEDGQTNFNTTLGFGGNPDDKHITYYFRLSPLDLFVVDDPSLFESLTLRLRRDDGAVVYMNGQEVVRSNLPAGPIDFQTLALNTVGGANENRFFTFEIAPPRATRIWIGLGPINDTDTPSAVATLDDGVWTSLPLPDPGNRDRILDMQVDHDGVVWMAMESTGVYNYDDRIGMFQHFFTGQGLPDERATSVLVDLINRVWIGTDFRVYRMDQSAGRGSGFDDAGANLPYSMVADLSVAPDGTVFCAPANSQGSETPIAAVFDENAGAWADISAGGLPFETGLSATAVGPDGVTWFGSVNAGPFRLNQGGSRLGGSFDSLDDRTVPACENVTALVQDDTLNLWIGCSDKGLSRLDLANDWTTFNDATTAMQTDQLTSGVAGSDGFLWFGTADAGVLRVTPETETFIHLVEATSQLLSDQVLSVAVDPIGRKWFGTDSGASRLTGTAATGDFLNLTTGSGLLGNQINAIAIQENGDVWFATPQGLSRFDNSSMTCCQNFAEGGNFPGDFVNTPFPGDFIDVAVRPDGSLFALTSENGAVHFSGTTWTQLSSADGLSAEGLHSLDVAPDGSVWIGGEGMVFKWDEQVIDSFDQESGLPAGAIQRILADDGVPGRLFLGGETSGMVTLFASETQPVVVTPPGQDEISCDGVELSWTLYDGEGFEGYQVMRQFTSQIGTTGQTGAITLTLLLLLLTSTVLLSRARASRRAGVAGAVLLVVAGAGTIAQGGGGEGFQPLVTLEQRQDRLFRDTGAVSGGVYQYRVDVLLSDALPLRSEPVVVVPSGRRPARPQLDLIGAEAFSIELGWPAHSSGAECPADGLRLYEVPTSGSPQLLFTQMNTQANQFTHAGLAAGTRHRYGLSSFNAFGESSLSPLVVADTADQFGEEGNCVPQPPPELNAAVLGKDRIELTWEDLGPLDECERQGFNVFRESSATRGGLELIATRGAGQSRLIDVSLIPATQYSYQVTAIGEESESELSEPVVVQTLPNSVQVFVAGDRTRTRVNLAAGPGSQIQIQAIRGEVRFNTILTSGTLVDADGYNRLNYVVHWPTDAQCEDAFRGQNEGHAALTALIGGQNRYVGRGGVFAFNGGNLELGINDCSLTAPAHLANSGGFVVEVGEVAN